MNKATEKFTAQFKRRALVLASFFCLALVIIAFRLGVLQLAEAGYYKAVAENKYNIAKNLIPKRGNIVITDKFSQEPVVVATNTEQPLVYLVPSEVENQTAVANALASILGVEAQTILDKMSDHDRKYVIVKKQLTEDQVSQIKNLNLRGVQIDTEEARVYPQGRFLANLLGFVGYTDKGARVGLYGVERTLESTLAGRPGYIKQEKGASGAWIFTGSRDFVPAQNGDTVILTIDRAIQHQAETVLNDTVSRHQANGGCIVIMEAKTGAVLALASNPDFNPNEFNKETNPSVFNNNCTTGNYEPGSVFKPFTIASSIDLGKITPETTYEDKGSVVVDGYTIKNSDEKANGVQTMTQVLEKSLNTGVIFAKEQIGNARFLDYIKKFGFGQKVGLDVPETEGDLSGLKGNVKVNFDTASFGQGISVTPMQLMRGFSAFANGGKMITPYLVQSRVSPDGSIYPTEVKEGEQVVSSKTASQVGAMLVNVVENGHGKKAGVAGYLVAGKTGTAQVARSDGQGYEDNNNIGTFIGFAPLKDPKFIMLVRINHPRTVQFAESTAAPAFGQLAQFLLNYYRIPPEK